MNWNAKKLWPSAALSLIAGSSLVNAADYGDDARMRNMENRMTALESSNNCCAMVNPPARPFAKDCWGFYVAVDPFVWQAHENGLPVAIQTGGTSFFNSSGENKVKDLNFDWSFGFRLAAGMNFDYDGWDSVLTWTRWHTSASKHPVAGQNQVILPTQGSPASTFAMTAASAKGRWKLHLNMLDWDLAREFYVSKHLTLRPYIGLKSAWINQKFTTRYNSLSTNPLVPGTNRKIKAKNDYWGIGPRGGIDTLWDLGCGWGLFGNYSASLMYGFFKTDFDEYTISSTGVSSIIERTDDFYHVGRAITDMQLGIRYDWIACDECYHFGVEAGWEHHMFWGQNTFMYFVDNSMAGAFVSNKGDLTTQGYFVRLRFDF